MKKYVLIIASILLSFFGYSQEAEPIELDKLVISVQRLDLPFSNQARSIELVSKLDIQNNEPRSLNELLQMVPGVDIRQRGVHGVQADLSIRGGTFEQAVVLINGIKLFDPQTGHHLMNVPVHPADIERIEVIKGPSSRLYGLNAYAGAINIVTKKSKQTEGQVGLRVGDFGRIEGQGSVNLSKGRFNQYVGLSHSQSDGYRYNTDYTISNAFLQSSLELENGELQLTAGYTDRDFGANGFYGNTSFVDQYETVQTAIASLAYKTNVGQWKINPSISWRNNKDNWQFLRSNPSLFQNFHTSNVFNGIVQSSRPTGLGLLGLGAEYNYLHLKSSNLKDDNGDGKHTRQQLSVFLEHRFIMANDRLSITPGIMVLHVSDFDTEYFPGLDMGYRLSDKLNAFGNIGWTTRLPSYTDLYYQDRANIGNPDLQEERAFTSELGLKYSTDKFQFQTSVFNRRSYDQIDWILTPVDTVEKWRPDNFNKVNYTGLEVSGRVDVPVKFVKSVRVGYTYIDAAFNLDDNNIVSRNQLEHLRHQVIVNPVFGLGNFTCSIVGKYNDRTSLENYGVFDGTLRYQLNKLMLSVQVQNIFDESYRESNLVYMPGRWASVGVQYRWK